MAKAKHEIIGHINDVAYENLEMAQALLDMFNGFFGTKYGWLGKRVVYFDNPDASVSEKYAHCHDAWAALLIGEEPC